MSKARTKGKPWTQRGKYARRRYRRTIKYAGGPFKLDGMMHPASHFKEDER